MAKKKETKQKEEPKYPLYTLVQKSKYDLNFIFDCLIKNDLLVKYTQEKEDLTIGKTLEPFMTIKEFNKILGD